jgi:hypothetical protein
VLQELSSEASQSEHQTVVSRMRECQDAGDRARCALTILLQHVEIFAGYLYGVSKDGATLLAGLPDATPDVELDAWVRSWTAAELATLERDPITHKGGRSNPPPRVPSQYIDRDGRRFVPTLLSGRLRGGDYAAAVLLMHSSGRPAGYDRALAARLADELLEHGDVSGVMLELATDTRSE